ncbi:hypothetical protein SAMN05421636_10849 [Pricia antarctica]|uniref:Uncharacterized protein n=1 Tax=Pricia antarctica TaxID=641691 RepID=A0A1G7GAR8_9FLAO|nr:hypothetical protein [Pricia antarctica]SDE85222.1 hypothetical protein SAMN05421636_10849 [Pricia antarctica]
MKSNHPFFIPVALFICGLTFAQQAQQVRQAQQSPQNSNTDKIPEIVIDLADENGIDPVQIEKYNRVKKGQFFRLKIDNVNTYLYDVSVANEDIDTSKELPASLLDLVDFGGMKTSLGNLNSVSEVVIKFVAKDSDAGFQAFDAGSVQTAEDLKTYFSWLKSNAKKAFSLIDAQRTVVDAIFVKAENFQNTMTTTERNVFGAVPSKQDVKVTLTSYNEVKAVILEIGEELVREKTKFLTVIEIQKETIAKNKDVKASSAEIKKVYEALIKASSNLIAQLSAENYGTFSAVLIGVLNNLDFSYTTLPIQRYSDVNELVISLKPRDKNAKLSGYSTVLRIPDTEKSFWGVSTGFYVTANPETNYSVIERVENGQSLYDFLEEDTASVELGINTMIRYGRRVGEIFDTPTFWHFGFGAGLSIEQKFKPRLMAGTGLAFGNKNKLFIDFGAIHMYYNTLSKAYTQEGNTSLPKDFLVNATKISGYTSLGYLISL